ncbi:polysaccharide deacetylase family protein [Bifidobacterium sp. DSM 109958]|uniref:Polysaccharide deacetylase family protein n=1 Tax=Bifidobacterium moraviense TaxID=2675323 RepID=A0A7Y0HZ67_9BIFI|nr:polysaccharide deacetylase family protein [Bifidobacterium sp. DSM 109958]NMN00113.1 polysaccharide deacetylase family protein [Bifidobacterium sp. DSM 109958]
MPRHARWGMPAPRHRIIVTAIACTLAVLLAAGLAAHWTLAERTARLTAQCDDAARGLSAQLTTLRNTLGTSDAIADRARGTAPDADSQTFDAAVSAAHADAAADVPQCSDARTAEDLTARADALRSRSDDVRTRSDELATLNRERADALNAGARRTLSAAVSQGRWWFDSTAGKVTDDALRSTLNAAVSDARALLDGSDVVVDDAPYRQATAALNTAMDAVAESNVKALGVDCASARCVALTFDDGPSGATTPTVIDVLERTRTIATFFTVGEHVSDPQEGALTKRLADAGYPIENHSWNHADLSRLGAADLTHQLQDASDAVERVTGYMPGMIRPPYSNWNDAVRDEAVLMNAALVNYDTAGVDWARDAEHVHDNVIRWTHPGSIILLHDIQPSTAQSIERIITDLKARGFTFVTIPQLLGGRPQPGWVYYSRDHHLAPDQPWAASGTFTDQW